MDILDTAKAYFLAWNDRDPAAIVANFADGGWYSDPATGKPLSGDAIAAYAESMFIAFPNLRFAVKRLAVTGDDVVAAQWVLQGVNSGPLGELPATGRLLELPGADFITIAGGKIKSVLGVFDRQTMWQQLGFEVAVHPRQPLGALAFGSSMHLQSEVAGNTLPGALSVVALHTGNEITRQQLDDYNQRTLKKLAGEAGFLSLTSSIVAGRLHILAAWENVESAQRALGGPQGNKVEVETFFGAKAIEHGLSGVWVPWRIEMW